MVTMKRRVLRLLKKREPGLGREGTQTYSKSSELSMGSVASSETTYKESDFTTG